MNKNVIETLVGAVVLIVAASFLLFAYKTAGIRTAHNGYVLKAKFERVDWLHLGSDVRVGGIKVGTVTKQSLDSQTYLAALELQIDPAIKLPKDTSAQIVSDGLLGNKYVALVPGADEEMLSPNAEIEFTQSAVNLETLIGKFMFSSNEKPLEAENKTENPVVPTLNGNAAPSVTEPVPAPAAEQAPSPEDLKAGTPNQQ